MEIRWHVYLMEQDVTSVLKLNKGINRQSPVKTPDVKNIKIVTFTYWPQKHAQSGKIHSIILYVHVGLQSTQYFPFNPLQPKHAEPFIFMCFHSKMVQAESLAAHQFW